MGQTGFCKNLRFPAKIWESAKVSHKRVFALLTPEIPHPETAQMLQKPVFALRGCQPMSVNTLLCDTLGLAENLLFPAVFCENLRPRNAVISQEKRKSAKICENQRKTANFAHLSLLVCPFHFPLKNNGQPLTRWRHQNCWEQPETGNKGSKGKRKMIWQCQDMMYSNRRGCLWAARRVVCKLHPWRSLQTGVFFINF